MPQQNRHVNLALPSALCARLPLAEQVMTKRRCAGLVSLTVCAYSMTVQARPLVFLDFDEVIKLNPPGCLGGYDVLAPNPPPEIWGQLFHPPAVATLTIILERWNPHVIITTSWLRFMLRDALEHVFAKTGLEHITAALHEAWEAPQNAQESRCGAIDRWLAAHHCGEPFVILDDDRSGTGLRGSRHFRAGRVIMCAEDTGLTQGQLPAIDRALTKRARTSRTPRA